MRPLFAGLAGVLSVVVLSGARHQAPTPEEMPAVPAVIVETGCEKYSCPPKVIYKGCPAPCSVEKCISVTRPCSCCIIELCVRVPVCGCERVKVHRDGDMKLDYGKYEVKIDWKDHGRKLVVKYDD